MKYKVTATYVFEVEADEPEWAQELVDVNCLNMYVHNLEGKAIYPSYEVENISIYEVKNIPICSACGRELLPDGSCPNDDPSTRE